MPKVRSKSTSVLGAGVVFAALLAAIDASGGVSSRLIYSRPEGATSCPDENAVRAAVAQRLGYDPFVAYANTTVVAEVFLRGTRFGGRAYLVDGSGQRRGTRELEPETNDCEQLVAALTLAISIALDPMTAVGLPPRALDTRETRESTPESPPNQVLTPIPAIPSVAAPVDDGRPLASTNADARAWRGHALAGALVSSGWVPATAPGIYAGFRVVEPPAWSLGVEGQASLSADQPTPTGSGRVSAWSWSVALVPCRRFSFLAVCALASAGELVAHGEGLSLTQTQTAAYGALGGRVAAAWTFAERWELELHGDLAAPFARTHFAVNGSDIWQAPALMSAIGGGVVARLW
jgi:hypothetical protein